ncbi:MAG TPA: endolytic transglycosylase MltG [Gemmatimonadales bacterium]|nr:endolytic transglycosylase MltG [Gemmatimonadales bacterium]
MTAAGEASRVGRRHRTVTGVGFAVLLGATGCSGTNTRDERVTLSPGTSFGAVTDTLAAHGVISNRRLFRLIARVRRLDRSVQAGVYQFSPGTSPWQVLDVLAKGAAVSQKFTVPEGLTIPDVAALASERLGIPEDSIVAAASDGAAASAILGFPVRSFEGFLRPETYTLPMGVGASDVVRIMAENFKTSWQPGWTARLDSIGMTEAQLVTFASIVEGEARADDERETIAGVYHNRLRIGMALQADPTIQYAIFLATGRRKSRLYEKDYQFASPYNTYLHPGLPPGPVNSPSRRSIEASLYPAQVPYLYFVAGPDGHHLFARTYGEHLRNIAKVRRGQPAAGTTPSGSTPSGTTP